MIENNKELQVAAIENGTVIDHIPPHQLFKVAALLELDKMKNNTITIANNLPSNKFGSKGMIKISASETMRLSRKSRFHSPTRLSASSNAITPSA